MVVDTVFFSATKNPLRSIGKDKVELYNKDMNCREQVLERSEMDGWEK